MATIALAASMVTVGCAAEAPKSSSHVISVFEAESFYRDRPEAERTFRGTLRAQAAPEGPDTRKLPFRLDTSDGKVDVYPGSRSHLLAPLVGKDLRVVGKLVSLTDQGFGEELWIGKIEAAN